MVTEEKIRQVRKQLRKGVPQGEIKNDLIKEGFTEDDLQLIFAPHRPDMRSWFLIFGILFLMIGLYKLVNYEETPFPGLLFLLFATGMFSGYAMEIKRIKNLPS